MKNPIHLYKPVQTKEKVDQCGICYQEPQQGEPWVQVGKQVNGIYHEPCLRQWIQKSPTDPQTRAPLSIQQLDHALKNRASLTFAVSNLLNKISSIWSAFCLTLQQLFLQITEWVSKKKNQFFQVVK